MNNLELYIHIPFCKQKCIYCDFLSFPSKREMKKRYVDALITEMHQYQEIASQSIITSIFIGGGTPSILEAEDMERIFTSVNTIFQMSDHAEISIEVNPGTVDEKKLNTYKNIGINRLSIGLQATNNEELKLLGRIHTYETFLNTYRMARKVGFQNINIDLISAIPKQTISTWEETLDKVIELKPEHISAYSLIVEEGTKLDDNYEEYEAYMPNEEEERSMYYLTKERMAQAGYTRYEISNYAKMGHECKHNLGYWDREDYLGVGLGAASLIDNIRYTNEKDLATYLSKCENLKSETLIKEIHTDTEVLSKQEQMEEFMFLGLRKTKGVSMEKFREAFGESLDKIYGEIIEKLIKQKLLIYDVIEEEHWLKLTEFGLDVSNQVMAEFI